MGKDFLGEPAVIQSIIPAWCRAVIDPERPMPDDDDDIPIRFAFVTPNGPGAWVDTTLREAERLHERMDEDLRNIRRTARIQRAWRREAEAEQEEDR